MHETPVPDSVSAVHNVTNPTRDLESEFEAGQEGKIREIVVDNVDAEPTVCNIDSAFNIESHLSSLEICWFKCSDIKYTHAVCVYVTSKTLLTTSYSL